MRSGSVDNLHHWGEGSQLAVVAELELPVRLVAEQLVVGHTDSVGLD